MYQTFNISTNLMIYEYDIAISLIIIMDGRGIKYMNNNY